MEHEKVVLVRRKTRLEGLVERFNTREQARFYLEHSGGDFGLYEREHEVYYAAVGALRVELGRFPKFQEIERGYLPNFLFSAGDLVVAVGIDGLVVNTAKYLDGQPLIAVNPDPAHIDGILLPFTVDSLLQRLSTITKGGLQVREISMAQVRLSDGQSLLAFNDLFVGARSHVSAHYLIRANQLEEHHSSSGVIISTGVGSSGWLSSMFNMANGMLAGFSGGQASIPAMKLDWDADSLAFVVREPFVSKTSGAAVVCGMINAQTPLVLQSEMAEGGVIFSDGVESDFLEFNAGAVATVGLAQKKTRLVVG